MSRRRRAGSTTIRATTMGTMASGMMRVIAMVACAGGCSLGSVAHADDARLFRLMGGIGTGAGAPQVGPTGGPQAGASAGGHFVGRALLQFDKVAGDFGIREGLYNHDLRSVGALFFGARWTPDSPWSVRAGLAHHHEVPDEVLLDVPVAAVLGTAEGIRHRTGLEVGGGRHLRLDNIWEPGRLGVQVEGAAAWVPDNDGPVIYGFVDLLFTLDVGPRLAR
jgi:hypothetical protein